MATTTGRNMEDRIRFAHEELFGRGNLDAVDDIFAADYLAHGGGKDHHGPQFARRFIRQLREAIPDLRVTDITIFLQHGDTIAWQRTLRGTHKADLMGIPPSGRKVQWREMLITRFDTDDKIAEDWLVSELAGELMGKQG